MGFLLFISVPHLTSWLPLRFCAPSNRGTTNKLLVHEPWFLLVIDHSILGNGQVVWIEDMELYISTLRVNQSS